MTDRKKKISDINQKLMERHDGLFRKLSDPPVTQDDLVRRLNLLARRIKVPVPEMWLMFEAGKLKGTIAEAEIKMTLHLVRP